ncbi:hypothetical protein EDC64_108180 [Aquabacter spiritensis]|uniref:Uncharacterized protein n=2 Tax=Aquabacter spiritensis TaxID=933073 RepID=A0A4R3LU28_9HYPH|nr:hypothetical protein EDC64_108180 [Aquabacter spiritensis]
MADTEEALGERDRSRSGDGEILILDATGPDGPACLAGLLADTAAAPVLVFYSPARTWIAREIVDGRLPSAGLASWKAYAGALLVCHRRSRRTVTFVSASAFARDPSLVFDLLAARSVRLDPEMASLPALREASPVTRWQVLVAARACEADPSAVLLDGELEAAALPLQDVSVDADAAFLEISQSEAERHREREAEREARSAMASRARAREAMADARSGSRDERHRMTEAERALLLPQLADLRADITDHLRTQMRHAASIAEAETALAAARGQIADLQDRLEQERAKAADLAAQLAQAEGRIETDAQSVREAKEAILLSQIVELRDELHDQVRQGESAVRLVATLRAQLAAQMQRAEELSREVSDLRTSRGTDTASGEGPSSEAPAAGPLRSIRQLLAMSPRRQ